MLCVNKNKHNTAPHGILRNFMEFSGNNDKERNTDDR